MMTSPHRISLVAAAGVALISVAALGGRVAGAAGGAAIVASPNADDGSTYSVTQLVTNNSSQTLTLTSWNADNGGTITQSEATVPPRSSEIYKATNAGNGVQLTLEFTSTQGGTFQVDTDIPRRSSNWGTATVNGFGLGLDSLSVGYGDNPQANVVIKDCTQDCVPYLSRTS